MRRITHVIFNLASAGGAETLLVDIANRQALKGSEVSVIVINKENDPALLSQFHPSIKTVVAGRPTGSRNPLYPVKLYNIIRRLKPEVLHLHGEKAIGMLPWIGKAKTVLTLHTTGLQVIQPARVDTICAISKGVANELMERQGLKSVVVYNGVPTSQILRRGDSFPGKQLRLLQIGRLDHTVKGQHLLIEAVAALRGRGVDVVATFVGGGTSLSHLRELARALGVGDSVEFLGCQERSRIYAEVKDYDIVVQPSLVEGFGLTIAEAMAAGVPVAVSDIEGPMEVVGNGLYGEVFAKGNPSALADAIMRIKGDYRRYINRAQGESLDYVLSNFDISSTVEAYDSVYSKLLD